MIDPKTIGKRLRFFRKRAGMSQLELETSIGASAGMVSRIENGSVNPTKESVLSIAKELKMNEREIDYVIGPLATPAGQEEIDLAINEIKDYFSNKMVFSYLIDDRFRMLYVSKGFDLMFSKLISNYSEMKKKLIGNSVIYMICDPVFGVQEYLDKESYEELLFYQYGRLKKQMDFMKDDKYYWQVLDVISAQKEYRTLWDRVDLSDYNFNSLKSKEVILNILGTRVKTHFTREWIWKYPRFETIEYLPGNKFFNLAKKVLAL